LPTRRDWRATRSRQRTSANKTREQNLEQATHRLAELDNRLSVLEAEPKPHRPEAAPEHDPDSPEARLAAKEKELTEKVQIGRISQSEMIYELQKFDNQLMVERAAAQAPRLSPGRDIDANREDDSSVEMEQSSSDSPQWDAGISEPPNESRTDASGPLPQTSIEREAEAAEYEVTGRGEMTDARAARLERLRSIDRTIERETRENEGKAPDIGHGSSDRSH
jgi:hypothetical protein